MARNRKRTAQAGAAAGPSARQLRQIQQTLKQAVRHHGAGRLAKAESLYRQILKADPENPYALHLLGVIATQNGDPEQAADLIGRALAVAPNYADAHNNLGNALRDLGRTEEALDSYTRAAILMPEQAEAHNNVGSALTALGRPEEAVDSYRMALALQPGFAEAHGNLGRALQDLARFDEALACYQQAIALRPDHADAYDNLGSALRELGRDDEALAAYRQAVTLKPDDPDSQANLAGLRISSLDDPAGAITESERSMTLQRRRDFGRACDEAAIARLCNRGIPYFRLKHDVQQADYLVENGHDVAGIDAFREAGRALLAKGADPDATDEANPAVRPDATTAAALLPYLQADYLSEPPDIGGGSVLSEETDWRAVEQRYLDSGNEIMFVDNFLSPSALAGFREFSLTAKVWLKNYPNKYLGAFSDRGYISPLHFQLARELQEKLPRMFGGHPLGRFWAFKYDSTLGKGINVHADFALMNLNFWITPDEHNLDPESGGLVVYDVPSPRDWHFKAYNENKGRIYDFLDRNGAKSIRVPHRCNRAVLFNSTYFHETDSIRFAEGYESRRINITYLFGRR